MLIFLSGFLLQASGRVANESILVDIRHIPDNNIKDLFVKEVRQFTEEDIQFDKCKEQLSTIVNNLKSPNPKIFFQSFECKCLTNFYSYCKLNI